MVALASLFLGSANTVYGLQLMVNVMQHPELDFIAHILTQGSSTASRDALLAADPGDFSNYTCRALIPWLKTSILSGYWPGFDDLARDWDEEVLEALRSVAGESRPVSDPMALVTTISRDARHRRAMSVLEAGYSAVTRGERSVTDFAADLAEVGRGGTSEWDEVDFAETMDKVWAAEPLQRHIGGANLFYTGIEEVDSVLGSTPGTYGAICAMPGLGKTSFAMDAAVESSSRGICTWAVSLETQRDILEGKAAASKTRRLGHDAYYGTLMREGFRQYGRDSFQGGHGVAPGMLKIAFHPGGLAWSEFEAQVTFRVKKLGLRLVLVDYFALLEPSQVRGNARQEWALFAEMSKAMKALAGRLGICLVTVVQPNGEVDFGDRPSPKNLGTTKQLFRDYDFGVYFWQPKAESEAYKTQNNGQKLMKCWLHKNRAFQGADGANPEPEFWVEWDPKRNWFRTGIPPVSLSGGACAGGRSAAGGRRG